MQQFSMRYIFGFCALICLVCSLMISVVTVALREKQEINRHLDKQVAVLRTAWLVSPDEKPSPEQVAELFKNIRVHVIDITTGEPAEGVTPETFDDAKAPTIPVTENGPGMPEVPKLVRIYEILDEQGKTKEFILPVVGKGLWSTMRGFLALDADGNTIQGLSFYEHGETPGLGGEVDNPRWKELWKGRKAYDSNGNVAIKVRKGPAGPPDQDPYEVDGLSGATLTSRGVTNTLRFWLADQGLGKFIEKHIRNAGTGV
ncbi:MAG TPA: Na(+)-translocating NADH-quinone reductase subunit C [Candidatus Hydrogenedentes bacterium]|nr:Na(+)-translocating NADH-quinone reductase subunit C [Candidatus Hydrogenedentota bacterium]HPU97434.1 Na(+)-translocating NADH-quinone reductase subunit C [Candidatus Hydrogenedentota bacterium]